MGNVQKFTLIIYVTMTQYPNSGTFFKFTDAQQLHHETINLHATLWVSSPKAQLGLLPFQCKYINSSSIVSPILALKVGRFGHWTSGTSETIETSVNGSHHGNDADAVKKRSYATDSGDCQT